MRRYLEDKCPFEGTGSLSVAMLVKPPGNHYKYININIYIYIYMSSSEIDSLYNQQVEINKYSFQQMEVLLVIIQVLYHRPNPFSSVGERASHCRIEMALSLCTFPARSTSKSEVPVLKPLEKEPNLRRRANNLVENRRNGG